MINLILFLALVGFLVYLIINYIPMPAVFKNVILVVVVVLMLLYLVNLFNLDIPLPHR